jgi:hypothetical protein
MKFEEHPGWEREIPKYRAARDIRPSAKARHKFEPPFTEVGEDDRWQYGTRPIKAREEIETREWPHESFIPLNYSASRVLDFFNSRMKSRMSRSPWAGDRLRLDDGLGAAQPTTAAILKPRSAA